MYRILGFVAALFLLFSCDDGDFAVTSIEFNNLTLSKCQTNSFIYKTQANESILLEIPLSNFRNVEQRDENNQIIPHFYELQSSDKLVYRRYSDNVSGSVLCSEFPTSYPTVLEEWTALAGATIEIITYANYNEENGGILGITNYTHRIRVLDAIFTKDNNQMVYQELLLGNYTTENLVKFDFSDNIQKCDDYELYHKLSLKEAIVMEFEEGLFTDEITEGTPRVTYINGLTNRIIYRVFDANITATYFCSSIPQTSPAVVDEWYADNGVENQTGIIEVETEAVFDTVTGLLSGHIHHVTLKNVRFYNNNSNFFLEEYYLGKFGVEN